MKPSNPVSAAASRLLERPLPPGYREDWARHYAQPMGQPQPDEPGEGDGQSSPEGRRLEAGPTAGPTAGQTVGQTVGQMALARVLLFRVGDEWLALPAAWVHEVAEPRVCRPLPHRRDALVRGLVNVRGELLVCVSLAHVLGIDGDSARAAEGGGAAGGGHARRAEAMPRLLVIGREGRKVAVGVNEVHGMHGYAAGGAPAPGVAVGAALEAGGESFVTSVLDGPRGRAGLLDGDRLLDAIDWGMA